MVAAVFAAAAALAGCPVLPADHAFNRDVSRLAVHPRSAELVRSIGLDRNLHPDFGTRYGIPVTIARRDTPRVPVRFDAYPDESDPGPYPIPRGARVEGGSDRHVVVLQRGTCRLYELFAARRRGRGWVAGSGAVFDLRSGRPRPLGWTSADAAGLPILPGLARPDEADRGAIRHALRFTAPRTRRAFVAPARHHAGSSDDPALPPMGLRVRLRRSFSTAGFTGQARAVVVALKRYGAILADNGSPWFVTGSRDARWDDDELEQLKRVPGRAFEAVWTGPVRRR